MVNIIESQEGPRDCGYRKEGGFYLMSAGLSESCGKFPLPLNVCPCCGNGIKQSRGWTMIDIGPLAADIKCSHQSRIPNISEPDSCFGCPLNSAFPLYEDLEQKSALLWVGERFYTADGFVKETRKRGLSKRIASRDGKPVLPKDFQLGQTWLFLAHPKVVLGKTKFGEEPNIGPAIFTATRPIRVDYIVKKDDMEEYLEGLEKRGVALIKVIRLLEDPNSIVEAEKHQRAKKKSDQFVKMFGGRWSALHNGIDPNKD